MPRQIIVDGKVVGVAPDDATDDELAQLAEELASQAIPATRALQGATSIGAPPSYARHIRVPPIPGITGTETELPFSPEDAAEALPAVVGSAGAMATTGSPVVAGTAGALAGEAGRQLVRRAMGAPQAPGVIQRATGADPDSPQAAAEGFVGEGIMSAGAGLVDKLLRMLSRGMGSSAEKAIIRDLLGGARNEREVAEAANLARRAQAEGITRGMTVEGRLARAKAPLADATSKAARLTDDARRAGATVEGGPVLDAIQRKLPTTIPGTGGAPRRAATAERNATLKVLDDEHRAIALSGGSPTGTRVPVDVALGEIDALDDQLTAMYKRGALDPAHGKEGVQAGVNAFRAQLREALPELADERLRKHELLTITDMLKDYSTRDLRQRGGGHAAAGAAGAALAGGYYGRIGAGIAGKTAEAIAPLSVPARQLLAKLAAGGAHTAQLWTRAAELYGINTDDSINRAQRNRRAHRELQRSGRGVLEP